MSVKVKSGGKSSKGYEIVPGTPLPNKVLTLLALLVQKYKQTPDALREKGTCEHYKRSCRWLRFPC